LVPTLCTYGYRRSTSGTSPRGRCRSSQIGVTLAAAGPALARRGERNALAMIERRQLADKTPDELADIIAGSTPSLELSPNEHAVRAEVMRRQIELQARATQATAETAEYTRRNARYMLWSVIALMASSVVTAAVSIILAWR
jgi:hypothetical protein